MRTRLIPLLLFTLLATPALADEVPVRVENRSEATLCAERDNVTIDLVSPQVRSFRVEARHPAYIGTLHTDRFEPDWHNCTGFSQDPAYAFEPIRQTLYESFSWQIVGQRFGRFWRERTAPVRIGDRTFENFHLIQLWLRIDQRAEEVLVLYPGDGYWRARPLPPRNMAWSAYGSSFLIGPVETQERPLVDLTDIRFDPETLTFTMRFARGGEGRLRLSFLDRDIISMDVVLDRPVGGGLPFATVRSMFVTETNSDVARMGWRAPGEQRWREALILDAPAVTTSELWLGRSVPSRHNTSAPDMLFGDFRSDGQTVGAGPADPWAPIGPPPRAPRPPPASPAP
jgi:hypothetical protein